MNRQKLMGLFVSLVIGMCSCICCMYATRYESGEPVQITIRELVLCDGWDDQGKPIKVEVASSTDNQLSVCGNIEKNYSRIAIGVVWLYKDKIVKDDTLIIRNDQFTSVLEAPNNYFEPGIYTIHVFVGKKNLRRIEILVD